MKKTIMALSMLAFAGCFTIFESEYPAVEMASAGNADVKGEESRVAAHNFDHGAALVGLHGVAQLVDALNGRVAGRVKTDGVVCASNVSVDRSGNTDHGDPEA